VAFFVLEPLPPYILTLHCTSINSVQAVSVRTLGSRWDTILFRCAAQNHSVDGGIQSFAD
jgi:hypothetical protein